MPSNYYLVLGVEKGANLSQIKRAYRRTIKRYHPDSVGSGIDPDKFIEAREAYEVLSDIDKRRAYDAELKRQGIPIRITNVGETIKQRNSAWGEFREMASFVDDFFDGFLHGFYRKRTHPRATPKDLYMEVILTPEEALHGGVFPVNVPVMERCFDCGQGGWWDGFYCPSCLGYGAVRSTREFNLTIPPDTQDGVEVEVSLDGIGLRSVRLFVHVRIRENPLW